MPTEMKLPELGENIEGGDVLRVMINPGDTIAKEQPVLELETDKATIEVPSSVSGVTMAVSTRPNGRAGSVVMRRIYSAGATATRAYSLTA